MGRISVKILSISTATNFLTVALNENKKTIAIKEEKDRRNHSEHLDPLIDEILKENNWHLKDIDRFAVAVGPGSYTGLRIGITTVKMFASILHKDLVGISTLQALAKNINRENTLIVPTIDARNGNFFAGAYYLRNDEVINVVPDGHYYVDSLLEEISKILNDDFKEVIFVGFGMPNYQDRIKATLKDMPYVFAQDDKNQVHADKIGILAINQKPVDPDKLVPKYLRRTQAEMDWHKKTGQEFEKDIDYVEEV